MKTAQLIQTDLFDRSRKTEALAIVSFNEEYSADFKTWLADNWHIFLAFERRALRLINIGMKHGGAKAIIENIRWQSVLAERESEFKCNNNRTADLSRLFEDMNKKHQGFFRMRVRRVDNKAR